MPFTTIVVHDAAWALYAAAVIVEPMTAPVTTPAA